MFRKRSSDARLGNCLGVGVNGSGVGRRSEEGGGRREVDRGSAWESPSSRGGGKMKGLGGEGGIPTSPTF